MARTAEHVQTVYDKVADAYDDLFSRHMGGPNERLTRGLGLRPGQHVADFACGTGVFTVDMAKAVLPGGRVVGVDYSEGMLRAARDRAEAAGVQIELVHAPAQDFIARAPSASFDVISMRFLLAYLDWHAELPRMGRLMRPGGRVAVLTSLSSSIPQFYELYDRFRDSFGAAWKLFKHHRKSVPRAWRSYRYLKDKFGGSEFIKLPESAGVVADSLAEGGLHTREAWTESVRLWFDSGSAVVAWMFDSGYVTHSDLEPLGPEAMSFLVDIFSAGMETFRQQQGVPLDLVVSGIIAEK